MENRPLHCSRVFPAYPNDWSICLTIMLTWVNHLLDHPSHPVSKELHGPRYPSWTCQMARRLSRLPGDLWVGPCLKKSIAKIKAFNDVERVFSNRRSPLLVCVIQGEGLVRESGGNLWCSAKMRKSKWKKKKKRDRKALPPWSGEPG